MPELLLWLVPRSLLNSKKAVTTADVEQSLDGNLCRCTGYRPILDAFKTFGADADDKIKQLVKDIEVRVGSNVMCIFS